MSEVITLSLKDPRFKSYLDGSFSKTHRALPIQSMNLNSAQESVTFKIVQNNEVNRPAGFFVWTQAIKLKSFVLLYFPIFIVLVKVLEYNALRDPLLLIFSLMGVSFLYAGVNLRNEYTDHLTGLDRIHQDSGSRVIQLGWLTGRQVKVASNVLISSAILLGAPILLAYPNIGFVILLAVIFGVWAQFRERATFKSKVGGELLVLLLLGPLLTVGFEISISGKFSFETLFFGFLWGWLILFLIHLKNFENILVDTQFGFKNTIVWLGFDRAKLFIHYWWIIALILFGTYHFKYSGFFWFWFYSLIVIFISMPFSMKLKRLSSSVGSGLSRIRLRGYYLVWIMIGLWLFENFWYMGLW